MSFSRILDECCFAFGQKVNVLKFSIFFGLKTNAHFRYAIKHRLGVVE